MQLCEMESRLFNYQKEETEVSNILYDNLDVTKLKTFGEAENYIRDLKRVMGVMHFQTKQFEPMKNKMELRISELEERLIFL